MARFWKVFAESSVPTGGDPDKAKWRYVNIYDIDEITAAESHREKDEQGYYTGKVIPRVHVHMHAGDITYSSARLVYARHSFTTDGDLDETVAMLEKMLCDDRMPQELDEEESEDSTPLINDRGEWTADESYVQYDLVHKPGDTATSLLCVKDNTSSSSAILSNDEYWCDVSPLFPPPAAE